MKHERVLAAFRSDWERLGTVASRLGHRHGNSIQWPVKELRAAGLIESMFNGSCLSWRLVEPPPAPPMPYEPPEAIEGPNAGLIESIADLLWRQRTHYYRPGYASFADQSDQVKQGWRATARELVGWLLAIGFVGPAGKPDPARFEGRNYAWLDSGCGWEIVDSDGGFVALVNESTDLEVLLAAGKMRLAIVGLLGAIPAGHASRALPEMKALEASLPENRAKGDHRGPR